MAVTSEVLSKYNLKSNDLNCVCNYEHIKKIASNYDSDWRSIGKYLSFSDDDLNRIDNESTTESKKIRLFEAWKDREGEKATLFRLVEAFHALQHEDIIKLISEILIPFSDTGE